MPSQSCSHPSTHLCLMAPEFFAGAGVVSRGYSATGYTFIHDRHTGRLVEHKLSLPLSMGLNRREHHVEFGAPGYQISFSDSPRQGLTTVRIGTGGQEDLIRMDLGLQPPSAIHRPITLLSPLRTSQKAAAKRLDIHEVTADLDVNGSISLGEHVFSREGARAILLREQSFPNWPGFHSRWLLGIGRTPGGRSIALAIATARSALEGSGFAWMDGTPSSLGRCTVAVPSDSPRSPLMISSMDPTVELGLNPLGHRQEGGGLESPGLAFRQYFGGLIGTVRVPAEQVVHYMEGDALATIPTNTP